MSSDKATKALKKENEDLKLLCKRMEAQIAKLTERIDNELDSRSHYSQAEPSVKPRDIQFLSDEYEDLKTFRNQAKADLVEIRGNLSFLIERVKRSEAAIDAIEQYSYQYNVKIVGIPQSTEKESAATTASLCLKIFDAMGVQGVSIRDIYTAHRVPRRRGRGDGTYSNNANPIICKFSRRLAKDAVMLKRNEIKKVAYSSLELSQSESFENDNNIGIYHHLTPRLQELLYEAKKFKFSKKYKYCWAKESVIYLRETEDSRVIKLYSKEDLKNLTERLAVHEDRS